MLKSDRWIAKKARKGMIFPFTPQHISSGVLSYGLSGHGYDLRLSRNGICGLRRISVPPDGQRLKVADPKRFDSDFAKSLDVFSGAGFARNWGLGDNGDFVVLDPGVVMLGASVEKIALPSDVAALCVGKSTYTRCGLIIPPVPLEAGWEGHLTIEMINLSPSPTRVYVNEGIVQLLFFKSKRCTVSYGERHGKYQDQPERPVLPIVLDLESCVRKAAGEFFT